MVSFLLSTGVCAFFAEDDLILPRRPLLRDIGSYALAVCFLAWFFDDGCAPDLLSVLCSAPPPPAVAAASALPCGC